MKTLEQCLLVAVALVCVLLCPDAGLAQDLSPSRAAASVVSLDDDGAFQLEEPLPGRALRGTGLALLLSSWTALSLAASVDRHGLVGTAFVPLVGPLIAARETGRWAAAAFATVGQVLGLTLFTVGQVQRGRARRERDASRSGARSLRVGAASIGPGVALTLQLDV